MINRVAESCDKECILYMHNFEREIVETLKTAIDFQTGLSCALNIELVKSSGSNHLRYEIKSNASFNLQGSYEVLNSIQNLCKGKSSELTTFISPKHVISVSLKFASSTQKVGTQSTTKEVDDVDSQYFFVQKPIYNFGQIILPESITKEIFTALNLLRYKELIYEKWEFNKVDPVPKSILNFYGPPGTGKTMTAHAVAFNLNRPLLALNYAEIESKYVGEAPKNLVKAFETAKKENAVLFFDEADSFLGKRIKNVTQGAEQALNSLRSQMLMLLEQHSGVIIFATNLVSNFDSAFESRILKHIKFELPNKEARIAIIRKMIPSKLPLVPMSEQQLDELAELADGFSGREIKGVILETLLDKVSNSGSNSCFEFYDFKNRFELKKEERKLLKEESQAELKTKIANAISRQTSNKIVDNSVDSLPEKSSFSIQGDACNEGHQDSI